MINVQCTRIIAVRLASIIERSKVAQTKPDGYSIPNHVKSDNNVLMLFRVKGTRTRYQINWHSFSSLQDCGTNLFQMRRKPTGPAKHLTSFIEVSFSTDVLHCKPTDYISILYYC